MTVSIIVPVYNCEDYLPRTLESIRAQRYENLDVILVDDGSVDRSGEICDEICLSDPRFRVIHQKNQGPGMARNAGLELARGEFIGFVDAGDYIHSQTVEIMVGQMNLGAELVLMGIKMTDTMDEETSTEITDIRTEELPQEKLVFNLLSTAGDDVFPWCVVWNKLYRKSILDGLSFCDLICNEDQEFNLEVYLRVKKAVFLENALYFYYKSPNSIIRNPETKPRRLYTQILSRYRMLGFLGDDDKPEFKGWMLDFLYRKMLVRRDVVKNTSVESDFRVLSGEIIRKTFLSYLFNGFIGVKMKIKFVLKWLRLI